MNPKLFFAVWPGLGLVGPDFWPSGQACFEAQILLTTYVEGVHTIYQLECVCRSVFPACKQLPYNDLILLKLTKENAAILQIIFRYLQQKVHSLSGTLWRL